jgi:anti-sigma-K factor RskA
MSEHVPDKSSTDDWILAAEYALGLIDGADRLALERRARRERAFAAQVAAWDMRFAALYGDVPAAEPTAEIKERIDEELFGAVRARPSSAAKRNVLAGAVSFWRVAALAFAALSAVCLALLARPLLSPAPAAPQRLIAALAPADAAMLAFVSVDVVARQLDISGLNIEPGAGDAELWVIPPDGTPRSLGLLERGAATTKSVGADLMALLAEGAALAISLEPKGGSPTGAPTGPVVALGPLKRL